MVTKNMRKTKSYVTKEKILNRQRGYKEILGNVSSKIVSFLRISRN